MSQVEQQEPSHAPETRDGLVFTGYAIGSVLAGGVAVDLLIYDDSAVDVVPKGILAAIILASTELYRRNTRTRRQRSTADLYN